MKKVIKYRNYEKQFFSDGSGGINKHSFKIEVYEKGAIGVSQELKLKIIEEIKRM